MPKMFLSPDIEESGGANVVVDEPKATPDVEKLIQEAVAKREAEIEERLKARYNEQEKGIREKLQREAEKAKMTAEEKAKVEWEERFKAYEEENRQLKAEKAQTVRKEALASAKLPSFYINDKRILEADDDDLKNVISALTKEHTDYLASLGKQTQGTTPNTNIGTKMSNEDLAKLAETDPATYRQLRKKQLYGE